MNYQYIINPKTNRKVSIYTKLGKGIIKNYVKILYGVASSGKRVHFDELASEWDAKCSQFSEEECTIDNNGFYCKWRPVRETCVAIEADDLEEIHAEEHGINFYKQLSEAERTSLEKYNEALDKTRISGFTRDSLEEREKIQKRQKANNFNCIRGKTNNSRCPISESITEYPCFESNDGVGEVCWDEEGSTYVMARPRQRAYVVPADRTLVDHYFGEI